MLAARTVRQTNQSSAVRETPMVYVAWLAMPGRAQGLVITQYPEQITMIVRSAAVDSLQVHSVRAFHPNIGYAGIPEPLVEERKGATKCKRTASQFNTVCSSCRFMIPKSP